MDDARRRHRFGLRLTPWGWILTVALVVLVVLAIVAPSPGVFVGLIAVIVVWAGLLGSTFPSSRGRYSARRGTEDYGREAADEYERKYGHRY